MLKKLLQLVPVLTEITEQEYKRILASSPKVETLCTQESTPLGTRVAPESEDVTDDAFNQALEKIGLYVQRQRTDDIVIATHQVTAPVQQKPKKRQLVYRSMKKQSMDLADLVDDAMHKQMELEAKPEDMDKQELENIGLSGLVAPIDYDEVEAETRRELPKELPLEPVILGDHSLLASTNKVSPQASIYVDGSWSPNHPNIYGYAVILIYNRKDSPLFEMLRLYCTSHNEVNASYRNIAGELEAAALGSKLAYDMGIRHLHIYYDCDQVVKLARAVNVGSKALTAQYQKDMLNLQGLIPTADERFKADPLRLNFTHVYGHSGDPMNEYCDCLAKRGVGIGCDFHYWEDRATALLEIINDLGGTRADGRTRSWNEALLQVRG